jgi:hypothetical protein
MSVRWLSLIGVFVAAMTGIALDRMFGAGMLGYCVGCLAAAVVVYLLNRDIAGVVAAALFALFAVVASVVAVVQQFHAIGWGTALVIDVPVAVAVAFALWFAVFGRHRRAAARLCRQAADGLGWRYRKPDAELLRRVRLAFPGVRDRVRTLYAASEGTFDGPVLTFVTGRTVPQAWLVRLPFALPRLVVRPGDRSSGGASPVSVSGGEPELRATLLTPAVVDATLAGRLTGWGVERDDLVVVFDRVDGPQTVQRDAAHVASLVQALPLDALRPHAIDPDAVPDPKQWAVQIENRRFAQRAVTGLAAGLAALVGSCGFYNVRIPSHAHGSVIMLWIGGGLLLLGALLWVAVPRQPSRADAEAHATTGG